MRLRSRLTRLAVVSLLVASLGCSKAPSLPAPSSGDYDKVVAAFYVGLAALQVGDDARADTKLGEVTRLARDEPAGWADWAILALRQRNFDVAGERLQRARELSPQDSHIDNLLGRLESSRGHSAEAIGHFRSAAERSPRDLRSRYALAEEIDRQGGADADGQYQQAIENILALAPDNVAAQLELCRIAAKRGDAATLQSAISRIASGASAWPPEVQEQFGALRAAAASDLPAAATRTTILRNVLWRVPEFRRSFSKLKAPPGEELEPYTRFVRMASPAFRPAPADTALAFDVQPVAGAEGHRWNWIGAIQLASTGAPIVAWADAVALTLANGTRLPFPGGAKRVPPSPEGILQIDFNYDFKTDLVFAGAGGVRFFRQESPDTFTDVTRDTRLPKAVIEGRYTGAWAADIEADGDLDIVVGADEGVPLVLRNNGDGSFVPIRPFSGISGLRQFAWADLDGDGNPDAAIVDGGGRLHAFVNERQGRFRELALPADLGPVKAMAVAAAANEETLGLIVVQADGRIVRLANRDAGARWETTEVARVPDAARDQGAEMRLHVADLDNNGAIDLYLAPIATEPPSSTRGAMIWLGNETGGFTALDGATGPDLVFDATDLEGEGRITILGLTHDGKALRAPARSTKHYHWQIVRPRAAQAFGDQRVNPFGVGGEIEIRAGLLVQKQPITGPQVRFGLGEQAHADVIRVVWPNGSVSAEFEAKVDQDIQTEQRLKGSCPFLFAYNGREMAFVKDAVPWGSAIGLRINTLGSAKVAATEEWYKIGREALVPHDGFYDLRFTAELWEVYYYDYLALMSVDHPAGTEVFVDERFVIPPAKLAVTTVETPHPILRAIDDAGADMTEIVRALDGRTVDSFGHGQYQGVTRDHYLEVDLGDAVPRTGSLYLIAHGSIYPTDSSINVALSQGQRWRARGLSLEVPDDHGGWRVARNNLGFPAGRKKTILIDLTGVFRPGTPRRLRLRTNLEIYWDAIEWARGLPDPPLETEILEPAAADLHYRGYSFVDKSPTSGIEVPDYARLSATKQRWRDLTGYYTRYGDVRELLARTDDRYVIMNSGDEMALRFAELPPPRPGWLRDFVIVGDGWIKDGDYNSTFSKTVLPLPHHGERDYTSPPRTLEDEWAYRHHPEDWQDYHTRYVTPDVFRNALRQAAE